MKQNFRIKGITVILLSILVGTPIAGCLCIDSECCSVPSGNCDSHESIQESGNAECEDCCTKERCSTPIKTTSHHATNNSAHSVLSLLAIQTQMNATDDRAVLSGTLIVSSTYEYFVSQTNSFLYSTKTTGLLI